MVEEVRAPKAAIVFKRTIKPRAAVAERVRMSNNKGGLVRIRPMEWIVTGNEMTAPIALITEANRLTQTWLNGNPDKIYNRNMNIWVMKTDHLVQHWRIVTKWVRWIGIFAKHLFLCKNMRTERENMK